MELPFHIWVDDLNPRSGSKVIVVGISIKGKDINSHLGSLGQNTGCSYGWPGGPCHSYETATTVTCYIDSAQVNKIIKKNNRLINNN